jgi:hypothetical protein
VDDTVIFFGLSKFEGLSSRNFFGSETENDLKNKIIVHGGHTLIEERQVSKHLIMEHAYM